MSFLSGTGLNYIKKEKEIIDKCFRGGIFLITETAFSRGLFFTIARAQRDTHVKFATGGRLIFISIKNFDEPKKGRWKNTI